VVEELKKIVVLLLALMLLLSTHLLIMSARSDVIIPYEWIVPGAYAKYIGGTPEFLFYPNHTWVVFHDGEAFLEWTVLERVGDSVLLNLTFFVNSTHAETWFTESVPDGKVNILDIATVAKVFGTEIYEWEFDPNADVTEDQKVDIMDIATVAKAYGTIHGDPKYDSKADVAPEELRWYRDIRWVHHKNLLLDIDVYSRETFLDGKPLGKTCFWADPYVDINDTVVLYGLPPDEIIGTVTGFMDMTLWFLPGVTGYTVWAFQIDPFLRLYPYFDWDTGMAIRVELQGSQPADPDCDYTWDDIPVTRFASTPLGTELNLGAQFITFDADLISTNVQLGPP